jgi:hypothetical protein
MMAAERCRARRRRKCNDGGIQAKFGQDCGQFFLTLCAKRPNIDRMIANATFLRRRSQPLGGLLLCA